MQRQATFYVQIVPEYGRTYGDGPPPLRGIRVGRVTQKFPRSTDANALVCRIAVEIDDVAFQPLRPDITIAIPAERVQAIRVISEPVEIPDGHEAVA